MNSAGNCFNLSVIEFAPTHTLTRGPGGRNRTWIYMRYIEIRTRTVYSSNAERKPSKTTYRNEHYHNMETQLDVVFKLSGSPNTSYVSSPAFFFLPLLVNCVYCLDIRAWFGSFLNKCLKRCESFNDWIE